MITSQSRFKTLTVLCWAPRNEMSSMGSTSNRSRFLVFLHIVVATTSRRILRNASVFFFSVTCTEKTNVLMNGNVTWNCTDGLIHIYMTCLKSVTESAEATSRICCEFHVQTPSYRSTKRPGNASLNLLIWFIGFTLVFNNTIIRSYNMLPRGMNSMPKFWKAAKNYNTIHCLVRPFSLKEYFCHHTAAFKTSS